MSADPSQSINQSALMNHVYRRFKVFSQKEVLLGRETVSSMMLWLHE